LGITGGNRDYLNTKINVGGKGALADYTHKQGDGARDKTNSNIEDLNFKFTRELNEQQAITLRTNWFNESSQVSYSGVTQREYQNFGGEYNPFNHDRFDTNRYGLSATHDWAINSEISLTTNVYYSYFERDWWRQQSNTTAGNISAGTGCAAFAANRINGVALSGDTCQGVQGRLRTYNAYGVEPRLSVTHAWGELELGAKVHYEDQERRQVNGTSPTARTGALAENNERKTEAYSGFVSNRFDIGKFSLTPAIRYENIKNQRSNRLTGANGDSILTEWIPGVGLAYNPHPQLTVFAGVHRGFAPPRTEDLISNAGGAIDVSAERSTNWELGFRTQPSAKLNIEATAFYNDFKNLIAVGSVASNVNLSQGQATFAGVELNGKYDFDHGFYSRLALTWLPKADQDKPFREVVAGTVVAGSAAGNRQPYAPKQTITAAFGYKMGAWDTQLEAVHVGKQYSDFAETKDVPNTALGLTGQIGEIASYTVFNAALNYRYEPYKATFFITGKNLFDREYIVDRTRGILTGMPRLIQAGMRYDF
jgi:Fe(3+) dicitrate transport protein